MKAYGVALCNWITNTENCLYIGWFEVLGEGLGKTVKGFFFYKLILLL